ncbi:MAG: N-6 DNA methylase [Ruminococcus flavefaciens]|nr:N-6 DNA methylase [Ruminococcus flavefaciens]
MADNKQKTAAKNFAEYWHNKGDEKSDTQSFWIMLLREVFGVTEPEKMLEFEKRVKDESTNFIDCYIYSTKVLIEQKSLDKDLAKKHKQSDGSEFTPFEQAKRYANALPYSEHPRWIVTCNFSEFLVYDMENPKNKPEQIFLKDLPKEYYRLQFLVDTSHDNIKKEIEVSLKAGEFIGKLYDLILNQYKNPKSPETLKSLNKLCVRLVFCLYAESAGIFGKHQMFHDYLKKFPASEIRSKLIELFKILDTKSDDRYPYLDEDLLAFPYVNGGLFADEDIEIPRFTEEIVHLLLHNASEDFDWSDISPTIFGAMFESTLNPETRRSGGMHYTSIENIHKVIDPLFLDNLKKEFADILEIKVNKTRLTRLEDFRNKLASLTFFDPACGSGNFLTETYICLRRLENEILRAKFIAEKYDDGQMSFNVDGLIKVGINQFYGIEINDFAVTVAKTALWIAESQMMQETEKIVERTISFLPLKSYANIVEGNSLRIDWESVVDKNKLNYIMGNPPFSAGRRMGESQRDDMNTVAYDFAKNGDLDYVSAWYIIAARYMQGTNLKAGFVSTSSITQGEQVVLLWKTLFEKYHLNIIHAVRSFKWESEAQLQACVHCVIIEFEIGDNTKEKTIIDNGSKKKVSHINGYLMGTSDIWIEGAKKPICKVPIINNGSKPLDNAICAFTPEEKILFIKKEPKSEPYFFRYMGSKEFINNIERWFLFINRIPPHILSKMPTVLKLLEEIRQYRLSSSSKQTQKLAETPAKFHFENIPDSDYLVIPQTSSGKRRYVPIGFLTPNILVNNKLQVMKNGGLYEFGVLSSNVHNAWLRTVCGYLGESYTYSVSVVYNTFPWCTPTKEQKERIEKTAQAILDARNIYPKSSLADLYKDISMPTKLRKAHQANDIAVMSAYGFSKTITESECVAELMKMYQKLIK